MRKEQQLLCLFRVFNGNDFCHQLRLILLVPRGNGKIQFALKKTILSTHLGFTIGKVFTGKRPVRLSVLQNNKRI